MELCYTNVTRRAAAFATIKQQERMTDEEMCNVQGAGEAGKSRDPDSFRNRIVDEALTDQSPRWNLEK